MAVIEEPEDVNLCNGTRRKGAVFLQWKGTNACFGLDCPACQWHSHFDVDFAYAVRCPKCGKAWAMQTQLDVVDAEEIGYRGVVQEAEYDPQADPEYLAAMGELGS